MSRFSEPQDPIFRRLNTSLGFDQRLWHHDVAQSRAHARMLAAQQIIGDDDRDALLAALDAVEDELVAGSFPFADDDEDIHMAVERRVTEIAGAGRRQAAHRALAQRPGRDRRRALHARRRRPRDARDRRARRTR